jgi:hypothetical protein
MAGRRSNPIVVGVALGAMPVYNGDVGPGIGWFLGTAVTIIVFSPWP